MHPITRALAVSGALALCLWTAHSAEDDLARARRIHQETIVVDSHIDTLQRVLIENVDLGKRLPDRHADLPRLRQGGVRAPVFALWAPPTTRAAKPYAARCNCATPCSACSTPTRATLSWRSLPPISSASLRRAKSRPF